LNPFEKLANDLSISSGNPELEPEHKDRLQLTYTMNINKFNFSPYLYHEFYSNQISNSTSIQTIGTEGLPVIYNRPENLLTGYEQGIGLNTTIFSFNINGSIFKGHFNSFSNSLVQIEEQDYFSYRMTANAYAPLIKKKLTLFAFLNCNGVQRSAQSVTYRPWIYGFGGQFNVENHSFGMVYVLPFRKEITFQRTVIDTDMLYSETENIFNTNMFIQIFYSYKFNKGRAVKKTEHKTDIESDTKQGGIGR
jgi:hypothetical protein